MSGAGTVFTFTVNGHPFNPAVPPPYVIAIVELVEQADLRLAAMNLAIRGIDFNLGREPADTFTRNQHPDLRADFILANPPFNISDWWHGSLEGDPRWQYGDPPQGNANYAWLQHIFHHLAPHGVAGVVLANGSMSSQQSGEGEIRKAMLEAAGGAGVVDCMVAMPGQLFYSTQIPACLWILAKSRSNGLVKKTKLRDRRGEVLFIDARKLGTRVTPRLRELSDADIAKVADTYHSWRNRDGGYEDVPGFAKAASQDEIEQHDFVLSPGFYVGTEEVEADDEPLDEKIARLAAELYSEFDRGRELDDIIRSQLEML